MRTFFYYKKKFLLHTDSVLVFISSCFIFYILFYRSHIQSDLILHIQGLKMLLANGSFPVPPAYFLFTWLLGRLIQDDSFFISSIITLSLSVSLKYYLTKKFISKSKSIRQKVWVNLFKLKITYSHLSIIFFCVAFLLVSPLTVTTRFYLGKIGINVWHNSTTIFLMPFAILLFITSYNYLKTGNAKIIKYLYILSFANILIKPSYFFVFAIVFPVFSLYKFKFSRKTFDSFLLIVVCSTLLLCEYHLLFQMNAYSYGRQDESSIAIAPFFVWKHYSKNIIADFLLSVAFPLSIVISYYKRIRQNPLLWYCSTNFLVAIFIYILLRETGPRTFDGNFSWQAVVCNYLLFLCFFKIFIDILFENKRVHKRDVIPGLIFALHLFFGTVYLIKYLRLGGYQ